MCIIIPCASSVDGALSYGLPTWIFSHAVAMRRQVRLKSSKFQIQLTNYNGFTAYIQCISLLVQHWELLNNNQTFLSWYALIMWLPCILHKNPWVVPLLWWSWLPLRDSAKCTRLLHVLGSEAARFHLYLASLDSKVCR